MCSAVANARWVKPHQLHVTLRFMGQTPDDDLPEIRERLARVQAPAFELALRGAGTFPGGPNTKRARVLWLGLDPIEPLARLKREIDACLDTGARKQTQEFSPHLTLARFPRGSDLSLTRFIARREGYRGAAWPVVCFRLYRSTLAASGALHEGVATYPLPWICRER